MLVSASLQRALGGTPLPEASYLFVLLVDIGLCPTLPSFSIVVQLLVFLLLRTVASHRGSDATKCALDSIGSSLAKIRQLPFGFLTLTLGILVGALSLE